MDRLSILTFLLSQFFFLNRTAALCTFPGTPRHGKLASVPMGRFSNQSFVRYECDDAYTIFGDKIRQCIDGKWTGKLPVCLREVAFRKNTFITVPENTSDDASQTVDNDTDTCVYSTTEEANQMWFVDLVEEIEIETLEVMFADRFKRITIDVRIGNVNPKENLKANKLCCSLAFEPYRDDFTFFKCTQPLSGRYVSIVGEQPKDKINICEARVYSSIHSENTLSSQESCPQGHPQSSKAVYKNKCLELIRHDQMTFAEAEETCEKYNATLVQHVDRNLQEFIESELRAVFAIDINFYAGYKMSFWLGATRQNSQGWKWVDGTEVPSPCQPNGTQGNCVYASSDDWNATDCGQRHSVICQYEPKSCGRIALPERSSHDGSEDTNGTILGRGKVFRHQCQDDFYPLFEEVSCFANGTINRTEDPACLLRNCNLKIDNGTVRYVANSNLAIISCLEGLEPQTFSEEIRCVNGTWTIQPSCKLIVYSNFIEEIHGLLRTGWCFGKLSFSALIALLSVILSAMTLIFSAVLTCCWCACRMSFKKKIHNEIHDHQLASFVYPLRDLPIRDVTIKSIDS